MSLKRRLIPALLAALLACILSPAAHAYTDAVGSWAADVIERAAAYGLMEGYPDGRFGVGDNMTRSQFVTVLCRMFSWEMTAPDSPTFIDCPADKWYYSAVETAAAHDAVNSGGPFRPEDYISRSEMAEMLVRSLGYGSLARSLTDAPLPFPDVSGDARGYIATAYDLGIITGVEQAGGLRFLPTFSAPREQAAAMLVRCCERYISQTGWLHGFYAFSSYSQLNYAAEMDAVSVGWARLEYTDGALNVNDAMTNGNNWVKPEGSELVIDFLADRSIPCNLSVFSSADTFTAVLQAGKTADAIDALAAAASPYAGLTIDFEGLRESSRSDFTAFLTALRSALPEDQTLYVCVQPDTWFGGYDYRSLGEICDKVILMAHDYQWTSIPERYVGGANTYSPVTPFAQVYTALRHVTAPETGVRDRSRLALAISFNTAGFHVDQEGILLDATLYHPATATIAQRLQQEASDRVWDEASRNPNLWYTADDGERYRLWYEDAQSISEKLRLARMFGVTGVSVWRLGSIPDYDAVENYNVWEVLSSR